jgi:hypothetical protein
MLIMAALSMMIIDTKEGILREDSLGKRITSGKKIFVNFLIQGLCTSYDNSEEQGQVSELHQHLM